MKITVNIARLLVGALFIFSGLVKAIDPLGLAYKMQEFFEAWGNDSILKGLMSWMDGQALWISLIMITLEVVLGTALIIGWKLKPVSWILLLLMLFFLFLTSYVLFSGKIRACGCFGDCIPLTPVQTFTKDIVLLVLVLIIIFNQKYISPVFSRSILISIMFVSLIGMGGLQWYVLQHLPVKDCLPYKKGNNLLKLREMPADAVPDKYDYVFIYQKNGEKKEFGTSHLPDSSWQYVDRKQTLVEKGKNNIPLINDFSFTTATGNDTTTSLLSQEGEYYLLFIKDFENYPTDWDQDFKLVERAAGSKRPLFIITGQPQKAMERFAGKNSFDGKSIESRIFSCDVTAIKTAARTNPALYLMKGPVVEEKWGKADLGEAIKNK